MIGIKKTFPGGVHPAYFKELSSKKPVKVVKAPAEVTIPLIQHAGAPCEAIVKPGDEVSIGTVLGNSEKFISVPVHSSVSGKVKAIKKTPHPTIGWCNSVVIESDGKDTKAYAEDTQNRDISSLEAHEIIDIIKAAGIAGLGGAAFPTHVKLIPLKGKEVDHFILNGSECEPYLTCDHRVMIEKPIEVLRGALLMMRALGVKKGFVAIEDNKPDAVRIMRDAIGKIRNSNFEIRICTLRTKYPQGGEKQLIKAVLNKEVPPGGLPFDVGCVVDNVQTALAAYEAVYNNKPLYERVITITGDAVNEPANLLVRIGTPISYVIEFCGGLKSELGKVIMGGPMMGIAQYTEDVPVIKGTSGILLLSEASSEFKMQEYCIRCGKCIESCPVNLLPTNIAKASEHGRFDIAEELNPQDCIECGACAYVCPANIPLVQFIKHAKRSIQCQKQ